LAERLTADLESAKGKMQRLTALYVDGGIDLTEFKGTKNTLVDEKVSLEQKLKNVKREANRPEPVRNWILGANQAKNLLFSEN
jgi:hypothetical protein